MGRRRKEQLELSSPQASAPTGTGTIWTIGHSVLTLERFLASLQQYGIELVADVRAQPASWRAPWSNAKALAASLAGQATGYSHLPRLGGRRQPEAGSINTAWREPAFRGYADHMGSAAFEEGLSQLKEIALAHRTAVMCAERSWRSCHRGLIADRLKADGWTVMHIEGEHAETHPYTAEAHVVDGRLDYRDPVLFNERT